MGSRKFDGAAASIYTLDFILKHHGKYIKNINFAFLDIKGVRFCSFPHLSLERAFKEVAPFISYLRNYYSKSRTALCLKGRVLKWLKPSRGVKQGDPLSPILFNIAMEHILLKLDRNIGIEQDGSMTNHIAYADDVVLLDMTMSGLQSLIDAFSIHACKANLELNTDKTIVTSMIAHGKIHKITIGSPKVKYKNNFLNMNTDTTVKYLGISFNTFGIIKLDLVQELGGLLNKVKSSYLKPQQRLWVLNNCIFGRLAYKIPFTDLRRAF